MRAATVMAHTGLKWDDFGWNTVTKNMALYYLTGKERYLREFLRLAFPDEKAIRELETTDWYYLDDESALDSVLDPARNRLRLDTLNASAHSPLMRTLLHANYTFRRKLSHSADSQDQRHRMVPASRPLLTRTVPGFVDVVEPELIASDPACRALFRESVEAAWAARARLLELGAPHELALYVLPNALAVRSEASGSLLHLLHKWSMRTCLNAQREIFEASLDEIEQVRAVHPQLVKHVGPPCSVRSGLVSPRCTEGSHFCGVPVWRSFPDIQRRI